MTYPVSVNALATSRWASETTDAITAIKAAAAHGSGYGYCDVDVTVTGGTAPVTYTVTSGSLPSGVTLNPSTGVISGVHNAPVSASQNYTVTAKDATGHGLRHVQRGSHGLAPAVTERAGRWSLESARPVQRPDAGALAGCRCCDGEPERAPYGASG